MKKIFKPFLCIAIMLSLCFCSVALTGCVNNSDDNLQANDQTTTVNLSATEGIQILNAAINNLLFEDQTKLILDTSGMGNEFYKIEATKQQVYDNTLENISYEKAIITNIETNESQTTESVVFEHENTFYRATIENNLVRYVDTCTETAPISIASTFLDYIKPVSNIQDLNIESTIFENDVYTITININNTNNYTTLLTASEFIIQIDNNMKIKNMSYKMAYHGNNSGDDLFRSLVVDGNVNITYAQTDETLKTKILTYTNAAIAYLQANPEN